MPRRGNNEGTVRQRGPQRWEGVVMFDGTRYRVTARTQAEVRREVQDLRLKHGLGELAKPNGITVGRWLSTWLDESRADWKPKTYIEYESVIRVYLVPAFGTVRLHRLTASALAAQYSLWRTERNITGGTLLNVHRVLSRALSVAMFRGLLGRNPCKRVEAPKAVRRRPSLWSPEQTGTFIDAAAPDPYGLLWKLLLGTGCRVGEALALRWDDLDGESGVLAITRSLTSVKGGYIETTPKTDAGKRLLGLPAFTREALRVWKIRQSAEKLACGARWAGTRRLVTMPDGTTPTPKQVSVAFHRAARELGLPPLRIHDLRHSHASLLLASGLELPLVSARLGHANTAVTASVYAHILNGRDLRAAEAIERAVGPSRAAERR